MRIDLGTLGTQPPEQGKPGRAGQTDAAPSVASDSSTSGSTLDKTSFSFDQSRVQTLAAQALAQPEIREAKVQALQQAIGEGAYSVSPSLVAGALASEYGGAQS